MSGRAGCCLPWALLLSIFCEFFRAVCDAGVVSSLPENLQRVLLKNIVDLDVERDFFLLERTQLGNTTARCYARIAGLEQDALTGDTSAGAALNGFVDEAGVLDVFVNATAAASFQIDGSQSADPNIQSSLSPYAILNNTILSKLDLPNIAKNATHPLLFSQTSLLPLLGGIRSVDAKGGLMRG